MTKIIPLILCGGSGTRLWPLSRQSMPKQFISLLDENSLFQNTIMRFTNCDDIDFLPPTIIASDSLRFTVAQQLNSTGVKPDQIIIEPTPKNTAAAILASVIQIAKHNPNMLILSAPSDHYLVNNRDLILSISSGIEEAENNQIVTFGIRPDKPETGYGYLKIGQQKKPMVYTLESFIEKPNLSSAEQMLMSGGHLWNSGILLFKASAMLKAFSEHYPEMIDIISKCIETAEIDKDFLWLNNEFWQQVEEISIDYAIMEKIKNVSCIETNIKWRDLGSWEAIWEEMPKDKGGVALKGNAHAIDCKNALIRSEIQATTVVGIGLNDIAVVAMNDCVLVAEKNSLQNVKQAVSMLKELDIEQATLHPQSYLAWGTVEIILKTETLCLKKVQIFPHSKISRQKDDLRSEHWVAVDGIMTLECGDKFKSVLPGESVFVEPSQLHNIRNDTDQNITLIEIQTGSNTINNVSGRFE